MSNDESDLEELLDDGMERIRAALDASENGELPNETAESVRESADAVAEEVADASFDELLTASGFEGDSDDVAPADLPMVMQDADPDSVLSLRHLLELADLSDTWSDLDDEERLDRLERIGGDETTDDSGRSVRDLLSAVLSADESGEATADERNGDGEGSESEEADDGESDGEEGEEDEEDDSSTVEEFRSLFDAIKGSDEETEEADGEESEESDGWSESGGRSRRRATSRHSTMPSSRSDMGSRKRHSTVRGKD